MPKAWTDGTNGPVRGKVMRVKVESEADVEKLKGKIAGKVLWVGEPRELKGPEDGGIFKRYTEKQLDDIEQYQIPGARGGAGRWAPADREAFLKRRRMQQALEKLYAAEKPLAVVEPSERDADVLRLGGGGSRKAGDPQAVTPARRRRRGVEPRGPPARPEERGRGGDRREGPVPRRRSERLQHRGRDLPGTDKKGEIVMVGAHLDSWHAGTGATDNAAGSAVAMEAMRILKALGRQAEADDPRRPLERGGAGPPRLARLRRASTSPRVPSRRSRDRDEPAVATCGTSRRRRSP